MKKLSLAAAVVVAMGTSIGVQAYTTAKFAVGQLAPMSWSETNGTGAWVGLTSRCAGEVYWTWFDPDSKHVVDDKQPMTKNDLWAWNLGQLTAIYGQRGYSLFLFDEQVNPAFPNKGDGYINTADGDCLASAAFWVDVPNNDVAYLPTFPVTQADLNHGMQIDLSSPLADYDTITALAAGAQERSIIYKRYLVNGVLGDADRTEIVTWTVCKPPTSQNLRAYNDNQDWVSVVYPTPNDELNWWDPEAELLAKAPTFRDGFFTWEVLAAANPNGPGAGAEDNLRYCNHNGFVPYSDAQAAVSWSQMYAAVFNALQVILNAHLP